jgi:hypothetical protein
MKLLSLMSLLLLANLTVSAQLSFSAPVTLPAPAGVFRPTNVEVANIDDDAQPEIIAVNHTPAGGIYIYDNSSWGTVVTAGSFIRRPDVIPTQPVPSYVLAADYNADGHNDLAVSCEPGNLPHGIEFFEYEVAAAKITPFCIKAYQPYFLNPRVMIAGNFNRVAGKDVFVTNPNVKSLRNIQVGYKLGNGYQFCISKGSGCWISDCQPGQFGEIFTEPADMVALNNERSIAIADARTDEFYLLNFTPADMECNTGLDGNFTALKVLKIRKDNYKYGNGTLGGSNKTRFSDFAVEDLNGDGKDDLIACLSRDSVGKRFNGLMAFYQNAAGGFDAMSGKLFTGEEIGNTAPYDLVKAKNITASGDVCFLMANWGYGGISVFRKNMVDGKAVLALQGVIGKELTRPKRINAADIDNDGDTDIIASDEDAGKILVFINNLR